MAKTKPRSPNYPRSSLSAALLATEQLYTKAGKNPVDEVTAVRTFGYKDMNGPARRLLSSMRKYGLIEQTPQGVRLSQRAMRVLQPLSEDEREASKYEAATAPELFKKLAKDYLTTDENVIVAHLVRNEGFTPSGARLAVRTFRENMAFVKAPSEAYNDSKDGSDASMAIDTGSGSSGHRDASLPLDSRRVARSVQVPLSATAWATVQAPFPITEEAWAQMIAVLNAMKPGLVADDPSLATDPEDALRRATPKQEQT